MLDMIADYHSSKREDRRSSVGHHQTTAILLTTRRTSGTTMKSTSESAESTRTELRDDATTVARPQRRPKHQVREFNDLITCSLCNGYLINATSTDICEHSFCRSCIVRYLEKENNCPQCRPQLRYMNLSNLRADEKLRAVVYKLVPNLIQRERESQLQFWKSFDATAECDMEEDFFYPAEPTSLSLEYHPAMLETCNKSQIPPVRYLQCQAGVTVHHLKRFLCYKYDIDPADQRVDIDIMYEDEILPEDFSLIDVGYCYNWKRVAPMRFCYRILVHSQPPSPPAIRSSTEVAVTTPPGSTEAKRVKKPSDSETMAAPSAPAAPVKTVRFLEPPKKVEKGAENARQVTYSVFKSKSLDHKDSTGHHHHHHHHHNNNNNNNNNNKDKEKEREREKNEGNGGTMKMIIARKQSPKRSNSDESGYNVSANDFKSLRSNDMRYSDYTVTSTTNAGSSAPKKPKDSESKPMVSIPQSQLQRSPHSSDESLENLTLAELKTAGKKVAPSSTTSSAPKKNVPKLKIELNSLKTKITIPKPKSAEVRQEPRKISKRKLSIDDPPVSDKVDLKTYAKNIGLKPISMEKSAELLEPSKPKTSPDASPMSTSSSTGSSASNGTFVFVNDGCSSSSSHKKRKKKHSKEPKDSNGKRRKLHAEISSQPADESLKFKVKITGSHNHRPHKVETRKSSSSSDEVVITTPTAAKLPAPQAPIAATVNGNDQRKSPKPAPSPPSQAVQPPAQIHSAANFNINSLNRALREESSNINNLMSIREPEIVKLSKEAQPKPATPQIMTTIHSRLPSNPQITSTSASKTPLPKPLSSIQDMKLPASPPLPPSLFKTTPLTIPTITATSTKVATPAKPARSALNPPPAQPVGQSNRPPKPVAPAPKTQFAVPHPPPKPVSSSPKHCPIPTIASSRHKQAAQLKRSASLDGPHPASMQSKHQKLDQVRKSTYESTVFGHQQRPPRVSHASAPSKTPDKPFYSSSMSSSYTHEVSKRKPMPMLMPPSSISVTKMTDSGASKQSHPAPSASSAISITPQQKQSHKPYALQNNQKPALEITCIPAEVKPPSSTKSSPLKATRPPPLTIPVKIKKSQNSTAPVRSPEQAVNTKTGGSHTHASLPALINMRSNIHAIVASKSSAANAENAPKQPEKPAAETNGKPPKEKPLSKDRRLSAKDGSVEILDLSGKQSTPQSPVASHIPGNSLEAALNKMKQNMTSSTVTDSIAAANKSPKVENSPDDLQNLHMLSESATNREKIAIKTLPKLNEISKVRSTQPPMRPQNASVRNIPNPSALAFRNQSAIPMLNSIATKPPTSTQSSSPTAAATPQPEFKIPSPPSSSSPSSSTNPGSPPRLKKNLNIEQVAANLNMRAAAAADKSEASSTAGIAATTSVSSASVVSTSNRVDGTASVATPPATPKVSKQPTPASGVTSSNVVSSSSSTTSAGAVMSSRETPVTPTPPKTSFKSISSLVAPTSSSSTVSAGTA